MDPDAADPPIADRQLTDKQRAGAAGDPHAALPGDERSRELRAIAHDFSNILGAILNYAAFIDEEATAGAGGSAAGGEAAERWRSVSGDARQIVAAARRGTELTERLRGLSTDPPPP